MEAAVISTSAATRPAAVAGLFYPAAPDALRADVRQFLAAAPRVAVGRPKILVVPHAGYVYSGATAASGYAALGPWSESIRRVVLIGPSHRVPIEGIAVPAAFRFATPLGPVELDRDAIDALRALPQVVQSDRAHSAEHALEVQLPFLQQVLGTFALIPLAVGDATTEEVADLLECAWGGDETLVVVSSDLSHYLSYERAREVDRVTLHQVLELGPELDHVQACGATPLNAAMLVARRHGLVPRLLAACNSGDTAGDRDRVVGYAALAFSAPVAAKESADCVGEQTTAGVVAPGTTATTATTLPGGEILLAHARHAIERLFASGSAAASPPYASFLDRPGATFVTLRRHGQLRGCIGSLEPDRPLHVDVAHNARAAALHPGRCGSRSTMQATAASSATCARATAEAARGPARRAVLRAPERGQCFGDSGDSIVLTTYGRSSGFCVDPIEKKPLNHFYPGHRASCRSARPAATWPASSARTGTSPSRARWTA
jgi:MEMO1 family protein